MLFCLFPGFLSKVGISGGYIKRAAQGAFRFFFACDTGPMGDHGLLLKHETAPTSF
jgi:hypothetical protein